MRAYDRQSTERKCKRGEGISTLKKAERGHPRNRKTAAGLTLACVGEGEGRKGYGKCLEAASGLNGETMQKKKGERGSAYRPRDKGPHSPK